MPYSLVLERASGTHNYSVQRKVEPTHLRVLCSVPVSQAHSNKFRFTALEALCFISLWCLGAQRKGMVIIMKLNKWELKADEGLFRRGGCVLHYKAAGHYAKNESRQVTYHRSVGSAY